MQLPFMHTGTSINRTNDNDKLSFFSCYDYDCWVLSTINFFLQSTLVKRENVITKLTDRFRKWELEPVKTRPINNMTTLSISAHIFVICLPKTPPDYFFTLWPVSKSQGLTSQRQVSC